MPESNFVADDLHMTAAFFGKGTSYDAKTKPLFEQIEQARRDLDVNGVRKSDGAAVWTTYQLDFMLPFPQVDEVRLSVGFDNGTAKGGRDTAFLVDDLSLVPIPWPADKPMPIGGSWYYVAKADESAPPNDAARGWHCHVTPVKVPYLIGGFWGVEEVRNTHHRRRVS